MQKIFSVKFNKSNLSEDTNSEYNNSVKIQRKTKLKLADNFSSNVSDNNTKLIPLLNTYTSNKTVLNNSQKDNSQKENSTKVRLVNKLSTIDDERLIYLSLEGDKNSYRTLVEKYQNRLINAAFDILKSKEDAEDVVQESFVKAYVNLKHFKLKSSFYTWIYRILYNLCIDHIRKYSKKREISDEFDDTQYHIPHSSFNSPSDLILAKEKNKIIRDCLDDISEEHRRVILLREVEGMSYDEISDIIGISRGTVMSRLHYARKRLQKVLVDFNPFSLSSSNINQKVEEG